MQLSFILLQLFQKLQPHECKRIRFSVCHSSHPELRSHPGASSSSTCLRSSLFVDLWHRLVWGRELKRRILQLPWKRQARRSARVEYSIRDGGTCMGEREAACQSFILNYWLAVKQIIYSWVGSNVAAENSRSSRRWRRSCFRPRGHFNTLSSTINSFQEQPGCCCVFPTTCL